MLYTVVPSTSYDIVHTAVCVPAATLNSKGHYCAGVALYGVCGVVVYYNGSGHCLGGDVVSGHCRCRKFYGCRGRETVGSDAEARFGGIVGSGARYGDVENFQVHATASVLSGEVVADVYVLSGRHVELLFHALGATGG